MSLRSVLKTLMPGFVIRAWRRHLARTNRKAWEGRSPQEIFSTIYATNAWGGAKGTFNSGSGSEDTVTRPYVEAVLGYIRQHGISRVLDLGCGDFRVGAQLCEAGIDYTGVDIVPDLIAHHNSVHGNARTRFQCANIMSDPLPEADLVLIRQVLQHLSNNAIQEVLQNIQGYRHIIISEHYPAPGIALVPNKDKPTGPDVRIMENSAVVLERPPFNVKGIQCLLEVPASTHLIAPGETIKTFAWMN
jgi:SAM-dependent methyltransferase